MEVMIMAFLIGLGGSLHCVGMCSPLLLALYGNQSFSLQVASKQLLYHSGRITTYAVLGGITGLLGQGLSLAGFQQGLSILTGVFIGVGALGAMSHSVAVIRWPVMDRLLLRIKKAIGYFLHQGKSSSRFVLGILNGFLPCGLIYVGLGGAMTMGSYEKGMLFMISFGVGTMPLLFLTTYLGTLLAPTFRQKLKPFMLVIILVFAVLLIIRGLNLGVPYLSPDLSGPPDEITYCEE